MIAPAVDYASARNDVLAVAASARSATAGWRAICVRERRRIGAARIGPLSELDLDEDAAHIARVARRVTARALPDVDTLVFGLFEGIDDGTGPFVGYHVSGVASHGRRAEDFLRDPWARERRQLRSPALDHIAAAAREAPLETRGLLEYVLFFGAAALTSRFAALGNGRRVVVALDEDGPWAPPQASRFAEIPMERPRRSADVSLAAAVPRLLELC